MTIRLTQLYIYPVKSMAGIALESSEIDNMGLKYDRRWMLVDTSGNFVTQRTHPHMVLIQPSIRDGRLLLTSSSGDSHQVPDPGAAEGRMQVQVWNDSVNAYHLAKKTDDWLSEQIGEPCHLVFIADDEIRQCDPAYAKEGDRTGFADGFPLLLISRASLDDLNNRLDTPVPMIRFRPNLVVDGCDAYEEDTWKQVRIGNVTFRVVKPCSRCPIPTVNPETGRKEGPEPLKTLITYRRRENKVWFGQNLAHDSRGTLMSGNLLNNISTNCKY